tara:strand:- start:1692 stop:1976 length:285 start_codon:yes stop_codon:yes gene_type:complete
VFGNSRVMEESKIIKMGYSIQAFMQKEKLESAKPKDLMPYLVEQGYFTKDQREGLPLRNILRDLDDENKLYLLPNLQADRKEVNTFWSFVIIDK